MHNQAAFAYQTVAKKTGSPREREANLLSRAASELQLIRDNWDERRPDLSSALLFNRKLWTIFLTSVTREDNPLPRQIRENVANLGLFVMSHSLKVQANPQPNRLDVLIAINRELAAGLRAAQEAA